MWRIPTATSSALAAVRRQAKAMDPTGLTTTAGRAAFCAGGSLPGRYTLVLSTLILHPIRSLKAFSVNDNKSERAYLGAATLGTIF